MAIRDRAPSSAARDTMTPVTGDLLAALPVVTEEQSLEPGACILRGFAHASQAQLLDEIEAIARAVKPAQRGR